MLFLSCNNQSKAIPVVLGTRSPVKPPVIINTATATIGIAQLTSNKDPNTSCPKIAPNLPAAKVTPMPVDL